MLFNAQNLARVPEVLMSSRLLFSGLPYGLIDNERFLFVVFLFLRHPLNDRLVVQLVIIKVVSHRQENVKHLSVAFTCQHKNRNQLRGKNDYARPGMPLETAPDHHLVIVYHWMLNVVLEDSISDLV